MGQVADIFISYACENQDTAKTLAQALTDQGRSVWWDRNIRSGLVFDEVIEHELTIARCAIVLWSMASVGSRWVRDEGLCGLQAEYPATGKDRGGRAAAWV